MTWEQLSHRRLTRRAGHLLLSVTFESYGSEQWWNWSIRNSADRLRLDGGGAPTEEQAKADCIAATRRMLEATIRALDGDIRRFVPGRTVSDATEGRAWFPLVHIHTQDGTQAWLAVEADGEGLRLPADVKFIEFLTNENPL